MDAQTHAGSGGQEASRAPERKDLSRVCAELNRVGAKYVVIGGFAIIEFGFHRFTNDIDFLIETSLANEKLTFEALRVLPDRAVDQLAPGDVSRFTVVRIADEVLVDLMASACGVDYATAIIDAEYKDVNGVRIPFASPKTLLKTKQTVRDKDVPDRAFLRQLMGTTGEIKDDPGLLESIRRFFK
jgi:hypothetical protein